MSTASKGMIASVVEAFATGDDKRTGRSPEGHPLNVTAALAILSVGAHLLEACPRAGPLGRPPRPKVALRGQTSKRPAIGNTRSEPETVAVMRRAQPDEGSAVIGKDSLGGLSLLPVRSERP